MIIEEYYNTIKRTFKAECLIKTEKHDVGKIYDVITYAKENSCIYVEDERNYQMITYTSFSDFLNYFKIV